jgi:hypothetical protein
MLRFTPCSVPSVVKIFFAGRLHLKMNFIFKMVNAILTLHAAEADRRPALNLA